MPVSGTLLLTMRTSVLILTAFSEAALAFQPTTLRLPKLVARFSTQVDSDGASVVTTENSSTRRARRSDYTKISGPEQAVAVAVAASLAYGTTLEAVPADFRLFVITYMVWSAWEYGFHRIAMHAKRFSTADKVFTGYNTLHIQHHAETNGDMTMKEDFDPHGTDPQINIDRSGVEFY